MFDTAGYHVGAIFNSHQWWDARQTAEVGATKSDFEILARALFRTEPHWDSLAFIKYSWLPFSAYLSFENLVKELENILTKIGAEFRVNFAS